MKRRSLPPLAAFAVVAICMLAGWYGQPRAAAAPSEALLETRFVYGPAPTSGSKDMEQRLHAWESELNRLGAEGWETHQVFQTQGRGDFVALLRRPRR